ncbi:MAG: type II toxin-antitoxin system RelE/ParE family toxin [Chlorobiales bacterium]|nr:type II toxin-antitoxin system RelE/ParE family toxin [Chlorobiales bacterium]
MKKKIKVFEFVDQNGNCPFRDWFDSLDSLSAARTAAYLERVVQGNYSNVSPIGSALSEIKIDFGAGYRIYFGKEDDFLLLLLGGSSKKDQKKAIDKAKQLWTEHKAFKKLSQKKI